MTTRITVTHEGPGHHRVRVRVFGSNQEETPIEDREISQGETFEAYVYDSRRVVVTEGAKAEA